jgi:Telomeric single stranded DNA binding POT1/CDC13.
VLQSIDTYIYIHACVQQIHILVVMSGQMRFFHPFLKRNNVSTNDDTTKEEEQDEDSSGGLLWISGRKTTSNSTAPAEEVIPYSQSYLDRPLVLHEDDATATQMESKKDKEETKTLVEWKRTYKRILMKYLARRISESDGSILDDTSNGRLQRQQQENYFPLKSRIEIMYYACKFGFFPRESFRLDDDDEEEEEEKKKNRKFNGNRKDVHPVLLSNHDKNHSSGSGDLSLVETSDVLGTQTFHLEQTTMNVSLTHGLHQRTDDTHQNRQDGIQPQSYESSFIVPCIKDLPSSANTVSDIHLMVSNVSIPLASVVNMWRFHRFVEHREETHCSQYSAQEEDDEDIDNEPLVKPFPREWLDLRGPVFTNYTSVVSFEIMECHEDIFEGYFERVRILSKAVFGQKTRRIRLFFYDSYAEAIENILQWAEQCMRKKKQTKNGTLLVRDRVLFKERVMISLKNVPAQCIFPYYRQDYQSRVHGKPLELEYGLLSDYCICIGGDGCIINQVSGDLKRPLRFDSEQLEVRFVIKRHGSALDEFVLNRKSLNEWNEKGTLKVFKTRGESGSSHTIELCKKLIHTKDKQKNTGEGSNDETDNRHFSNPDRKRKSSASHDRYIPFSELDKFYMKHANNRRKDREIDICAAVLNVGVPRLTKRNWMMNLTVFDASLQYPSWAGNETNIPQVRLVIFSNSVENFPQIDCAGDVIVGQRILVDVSTYQVTIIYPYRISYILF